MDTDTLQNMVQASHLLTDEEKKYWTGNIPRMDETQLKRLEGILKRANNVNWTDQVEHYLSLVTDAALKTDPAFT